MTSLPMSREARAEQLAADAGQWLSVRSRGGEVLHGIPSQRVPGRYWLCDGQHAIDQRGRYTSGPFTGLPATVREGSA